MSLPASLCTCIKVQILTLYLTKLIVLDCLEFMYHRQRYFKKKQSQNNQ